MVALISAVVPLLVALISTLRWPTLRRRIRDHSALLKDLPPGAAESLQALLTSEIERLVERDAPLLSPTNVVHKFLHRAKYTALLALLLTTYVILTVNFAASRNAGLGLLGASVPVRVVVVLAAVTGSLFAAHWSFRHSRRIGSRRPSSAQTGAQST